MIKTGQIVRNAVDRPAADLYLTLAQAMGAPLASFGDSTGVLPGVVL
jgi:predicted transcriptional regulator